MLGLTHCAHHVNWDSFRETAPRLKCYKHAWRLNRYNFPTDNAIVFLFSTLHTTPFHYAVLKIGSRLRYPLGSYSDSNVMHFYNILTVGRKLSQLLLFKKKKNWFHYHVICSRPMQIFYHNQWKG